MQNYLFVLVFILLVTLPCLADYTPDTTNFPVDKATFPSLLENMRPGQIRDAVAQGAYIILPVGVMSSTTNDVPLGAKEAAVQQALNTSIGADKAIVAPALWYAPSGYLQGGAKDGSFDMPTLDFVKYLEEVALELEAMGFKMVKITVLDTGQGENSLMYAACKYAAGDLFNAYWRQPAGGKGWWINPQSKIMAWEKVSVQLLKLPAPEPAANAAPRVLPLRLEQMRPSELRTAIAEGLPCFVPVGVIENHGNQNPVACDTIEAQDPLVLAAAKAPVVVAPTVWFGGTAFAATGEELGTTDITGEVFYRYMLGVTKGLTAMGFKNIVYIHVHQGGGSQDTALKLIAKEINRPEVAADFSLGKPRYQVKVQEMGAPGGTYDHAGKNETSWMLYHRGPFTDLSLLRPNDYPFNWYPGDESKLATKEWGQQMTELVVNNYLKLFAELTSK